MEHTQSITNRINKDIDDKFKLIIRIDNGGLLMPYIQRDIDSRINSRDDMNYILNVWNKARINSKETINPDTDEFLKETINEMKKAVNDNNNPIQRSRPETPRRSRSRGRTRGHYASPHGANNNPSHRSRSPVRRDRTIDLEPPPRLSFGGKGYKSRKYKRSKNKSRKHKKTHRNK
jgi:hypothetical protein